MAYLLLDLMPWVTAVPFRKVVVDFKYLHTFQMWKFLLRKTEHLPVLRVCNETSFEKAEPFFTRVLWDWTDLLTRANSVFLSWLAFAPCLVLVAMHEGGSDPFQRVVGSWGAGSSQHRRSVAAGGRCVLGCPCQGCTRRGPAPRTRGLF